MASYIVRRVLLLIPTFLILTVLAFVFVRLMPGDIITLMAVSAPHEGTNQLDTTAVEHMLGLDKPAPTQYWEFLTALLHGDMGKSLWSHNRVTPDVLSRIPITFELGLFAFVIAQLVAFPVGILSAIRQDSILDYIARGLTVLFVAAPVFWLGTMVVIFPSIWWKWSPPVQYISPGQNFGLNMVQFLVPGAILGIGMAALEMRMLRTTMLDILRQDYVRTAWAKGLKEEVVIVRHVLRNASLPVVTIISGQIPVMIGGEVILEQIFNLPGMGRLFVDSITQRDYPYITGMNALFCLVGLIVILSCDLSYAWLDPRIRYS